MRGRVPEPPIATTTTTSIEDAIYLSTAAVEGTTTNSCKRKEKVSAKINHKLN